MQKDFHFYCIAVLARAAGYSPQDAITIGYSSEYVDGATESQTINIGGEEIKTVRTTYKFLNAFSSKIQREVLMPFHFIPPTSNPTKKKKYATEPGSVLARKVFEAADQESDKELRLYRIGVALHTLADSWSHQGFSGYNVRSNDVDDIDVFEVGGWRKVSTGEILEEFKENVVRDVEARITNNLAPKIGHGQAGGYPDRSHVKWKYSPRAKISQENEEICNLSRCMNAAQTIYDLLAKHVSDTPDSVIKWEEIEPRIKKLFSMDIKAADKCENWKREFGDWFEGVNLCYKEKEWRTKALGDDDVAWDRDDNFDFNKFGLGKFDNYAARPFILFHKAARMQRDFVLKETNRWNKFWWEHLLLAVGLRGMVLS